MDLLKLPEQVRCYLCISFQEGREASLKACYTGWDGRWLGAAAWTVTVEREVVLTGFFS